MPQYDTDAGILEQRCYAMAQQLAAVEGDADDFAEMPDHELGTLREDIRSTLLDEFPDIEGPTIAEMMDQGLSDVGFPMHRIP